MSTAQQHQYALVSQELKEARARERASLSQTLKYAAESEEIGAATAAALVQQGEQLNAITGTVQYIEGDLKIADHHLGKMESILKWLFGSSHAPRQRLVLKDKKAKSKKAKDASASDALAHRTEMTVKSARNKQPVTRAENEIVAAGLADQDSVSDDKFLEAALASTQASVKRLRILALQIGEELDQHNIQLEHIAGEMNKTEKHLTKTTARTAALAR